MSLITSKNGKENPLVFAALHGFTSFPLKSKKINKDFPRAKIFLLIFAGLPILEFSALQHFLPSQQFTIIKLYNAFPMCNDISNESEINIFNSPKNAVKPSRIKIIMAQELPLALWQ